MELTLTEIIADGFSVEKEVHWLKCRTSLGSVVAFWGELGEANRNIVSLRNQKFPVLVEISQPEDCEPTEWEKSKYKISLSIPSNIAITINPEN